MDMQDNFKVGESLPVREIFLTAELKQRLDLIRHLATNSLRILLVRGVHGSGKSTLKGLLQQQAPADWKVCHIDATPMLQHDQMIYTLCRSFCSRLDGVESIEQLHLSLAELSQNGQLPVIIIDDAEQLPVATLVELFEIYLSVSGQTEGVALILFASTEIDDLLKEAHPQKYSQHLQVLELFSLDREQSDQLVCYLLEVVGGEQAGFVSQAECERIFRSSKGLPGEIRQQVEMMLKSEKSSASAFQERIVLPQLLADVSPPVLIGGAILVLLLLLTLVYEDEINAVFEASVDSPGETDIVAADNQRLVPLTLPEQPSIVEREILEQAEEKAETDSPEQVTRLNETDPASPTGPFRTEGLDETTSVTVNLPELPSPRQVVETDQVEQSPTPEPDAPVIATAPKRSKPFTELAIAKKQEEPATLNVQAQAQAVAKKAAPQAQSVPKMAAPEDVPGKIPQVEIKAAKGVDLPAPVTELGRAKKPEVGNAPKPVTVKSKQEKTSPAPVQEGGIRGETWLLKQSPKSYTLQLIGVGDEQAVAVFIKRHRLRGKAAYFRTKRNGRPWFPVLYGLYSSRDAAVAARSKIPRSLAGRGIWPRSIASVQQAIRGK
ncbi:MAG: AAA family ATPase [Gammaproteobacteria bacterium]|nr:AAA family ATPase [Gammaproteobacteria bacterium]